MNEIEYINYKIFDMIGSKNYLSVFPNGYRWDPELGSEALRPIQENIWSKYGSVHGKPPFPKDINIFLDHSWEPIEVKLDKRFWEHGFLHYESIYDNLKYKVIHSEKDSVDLKILKRSGFKTIHWFSHGYLCSEHWYRLYKNISIVTEYRDITTPWVCANRLIDNKRSYRIEFLNMLAVDRGTYSLLANDPQTGRSLKEICPENRVQPCSFDDHENTSAWITVDQTTPINGAFLHVVTETVVDRVHLTEKIFKPIVLKQPFVLVGGAGCLSYLQDYGFSTFNRWWSEDYDNIQDTTERMQAVAEIVNWIGKQDKLESLRNQMKETLDYNYHWFYNGFSSKCWDELVKNVAQTQTP
jgi:hypothetical protein